MPVVNDIHSQLNRTEVAEVREPTSVEDVIAAVRDARAGWLPVCVAGGRHSMGGQQFATGGLLLDMRRMNRVLSLDRERGLAEVEAGVQWPGLLDQLHSMQEGAAQRWTIAQKQTGADRLSIGGAIAANIHGRGLTMRPFVADIESMTVVLADASVVTCSRSDNYELFTLIVGGYGLFGVVVSATLRLVRAVKLQRVVEVRGVDDLIDAFDRRIADGFEFGDFQFAIDNESDAFLRQGIFSCYRPVADDTPIPADQRTLTEDAWRKLLHLAHNAKSDAFDRYREHYLATSGQIYWSDLHQLSTYIDDYHREFDAATGAACAATEMITELYVPREGLTDFMRDVTADFRVQCVNCIYGTVRLIERDDESFLAWARDRWACVIFNLHADHTEDALRCSADAFRGLIDKAIDRGGSYFLTYHRYARRDQVLACYPQFPRFLAEKLRHDPDEVFQSEWYRHYRAMFA